MKTVTVVLVAYSIEAQALQMAGIYRNVESSIILAALSLSFVGFT